MNKAATYLCFQTRTVISPLHQMFLLPSYCSVLRCLLLIIQIVEFCSIVREPFDCLQVARLSSQMQWRQPVCVAFIYFASLLFQLLQYGSGRELCSHVKQPVAWVKREVRMMILVLCSTVMLVAVVLWIIIIICIVFITILLLIIIIFIVGNVVVFIIILQC